MKERAGGIEKNRFDRTHLVFGGRLEFQLNDQHLSFGKIIILLSKIAQLAFCGDVDERMDKMPALPKRTQSAGEELANSISHGMGFIAALVGTPILLLAALRRNSTGFLIGTIVFTSTMLLLYLGSTLYHAWPQTRAKSILRVLDHSAIFLLIAGTYTPFALGPLRGVGGATILGIIWACAIFGVVMKATRGPTRHPKLAMSLYLGMGWLVPIANHPLAFAIPF